MRILGFAEKWPKLCQDEFTTFHFSRKDKDWEVDEVVRIVYKPRSKEREVLGIAKIVAKEPRQFGSLMPDRVTKEEAQVDGFNGYSDMADWFYKQYGERIVNEPINRITLEWIDKK